MTRFWYILKILDSQQHWVNGFIHTLLMDSKQKNDLLSFKGQWNDLQGQNIN
jgi:hypothetical protein